MRADRVVLGAAAGAAVCAWCGWASGFRHSTTPAFATWAVSLAGVVVVDGLLWRGRHSRRFGLQLRPVARPWPRPGGRGRTGTLVGLSPWIALVLVTVAWEVLGIDTGTHEPHLTISAMAQAFRPLNAALLLTWIGVGIGCGVALARAPLDGALRPAAPAPLPANSPAARGSGRDWSSLPGDRPPLPPDAGPPGRDDGSLAPGDRPPGRDTRAMAVATTHPVLAPALLLPASRPAGVAFWLSLVGVAVLLDIVARQTRGRLATAGEAARFVLRNRVVTAVLAAGWVYAGWHLFAH